MEDYLSRLSSAAAPETSYYDESLTIAKLQMINDVLKPRDQLNPSSHKINKLTKIRQ